MDHGPWPMRCSLHALTLASEVLFQVSARLEFRAGLITSRHHCHHTAARVLGPPIELGKMWFSVWSLKTVPPPFIALTTFQPFGLRPIILRLFFSRSSLPPPSALCLCLRPLFLPTQPTLSRCSDFKGSNSLRKTPLGPGPGRAATSRDALPAASSCARLVAAVPSYFARFLFSSSKSPNFSPLFDRLLQAQSGPTTAPSNSPPASPTLNPTQRSEDATRERTRMGPFHNSFFFLKSRHTDHTT